MAEGQRPDDKAEIEGILADLESILSEKAPDEGVKPKAEPGIAGIVAGLGDALKFATPPPKPVQPSAAAPPPPAPVKPAPAPAAIPPPAAAPPKPVVPPAAVPPPAAAPLKPVQPPAAAPAPAPKPATPPPPPAAAPPAAAPPAPIKLTPAPAPEPAPAPAVPPAPIPRGPVQVPLSVTPPPAPAPAPAAAAPPPKPAPAPAPVPTPAAAPVPQAASAASTTGSMVSLPDTIPAEAPKDQIRRVAFLYAAGQPKPFVEFIKFVDSLALQFSKKPLYLRKVFLAEVSATDDTAAMAEKIRATGAVGIVGVLSGIPDAKVRALESVLTAGGISFYWLTPEEAFKRPVVLGLVVELMLLNSE